MDGTMDTNVTRTKTGEPVAIIETTDVDVTVQNLGIVPWTGDPYRETLSFEDVRRVHPQTMVDRFVLEALASRLRDGEEAEVIASELEAVAVADLQALAVMTIRGCF